MFPRVFLHFWVTFTQFLCVLLPITIFTCYVLAIAPSPIVCIYKYVFEFALYFFEHEYDFFSKFAAVPIFSYGLKYAVPFCSTSLRSPVLSGITPFFMALLPKSCL